MDLGCQIATRSIHLPPLHKDYKAKWRHKNECAPAKLKALILCNALRKDILQRLQNYRRASNIAGAMDTTIIMGVENIIRNGITAPAKLQALPPAINC